jgi:hypothetical protein
LLPIPVYEVTNIPLHDSLFVDDESLAGAERKHRRRGVQAWIWVLLVVLNYMHGFRGRGECARSGPWTTSQSTAVQRLQTDVERFCCQVKEIPDISVEELLGTDEGGYESAGSCVALTWELVKTALPEPELCGRVPALEVAGAGVRAMLSEPGLILVDRSEWSSRLAECPPARVIAEPGEWDKIKQGLIDHHILRPLKPEEVSDVGSEEIIGGCFGVAKSDGVGCRFIMNLVPLNSVCRGMEGECRTLPYFGQALVTKLEAHEKQLYYSEDLRAFFYLFALPQEWHVFMRIGDSRSSSRSTMVGSTVLPMGWKNSVSIAQHLHRQLPARLAKAGRDVLPAWAEVRKDRVGVMHPGGRRSPDYQIYLDNFDHSVTLPSHQAHDFVGRVSRWQQLMREVYAELGLPINDKKSVVGSTSAVMLGGVKDGETGELRPSAEKVGKALRLVLDTLVAGRCSFHQLQATVGRLVYLAQYRRPVMSCFRGVFEYLTPGGGRLGWKSRDGRFRAGTEELEEYGDPAARQDQWGYPRGRYDLPGNVLEELAMGVVLLPLARMDFRLHTLAGVSASDASEQGGGACLSSSLTKEGEEYLKAEMVMGRQYVADGELFVVCSGDEAGSVYRALEILRITCVGKASCHIRPESRKVLERQYGNILFWSTDRESLEEEVRQAALDHCQCSGVLVVANISGARQSEEAMDLSTRVAELAGAVGRHFFLVPDLYCRLGSGRRLSFAGTLVDGGWWRRCNSHVGLPRCDVAGLRPQSLLFLGLTWARSRSNH